MAKVIIDSSFLIAVLAEEEYSDWSRRTMTGFDGDDLCAPSLLVWEVASVLQKKLRQRRLSERERAMMLSRFDAFEISLHAPPPPGELPALLEMSERTGLTAYDTAYLLLAAEEEAALASLDAALVRAARAEGLTVHAPF